MNRRITFYYTFLLIIATMFTALGNYQNIYATSTFSGLYDGTLNSNLNGTLNTLTPFNDEVNNTESNNLQDCANCIGNDGIDQGISAPIISNDNPNENDIGISGGGSNDNPNENGNDNPNENGNDNPNENDIGISGGGSNDNDNGDLSGGGSNDNDNGDLSGGGSNDNPNENDVSGDSPFSLPFNTQFADPSDDADGDISDKIPFP